MQLEKNYNPSTVESHWYANWQHHKYYETDINTAKIPYSILMPPPNVTGMLTMGHVLNNTIQDIYIRWNRLRDKDSQWFPGLDHAGIATQTKVEQLLKEQGLSRHDLGRDAFVDKVWEWKEKYGSIILEQLRSLGVSANWSKTLFTMDERASRAVTEVFIRLFEEGLIYRGKRIINWSPVAQSALSDEEVVFKEVQDTLYTLRYSLESGDGFLCVATARPETIFGDVAVAVNPQDERYAHLIGTKVQVPLAGMWIPVIADDYADPAFGTGCVKITPAHDPNDYEVGLRNNLPMPCTINPDATLNELTGEFQGLDRFDARKKIVKKLEELDRIEKTESYTHNVGFSERGGEPVEPYLSDQWFVNMAPLAQPALEAVQNGSIKFYPEHWSKTYSHWMTNIRDWCISRQLWWGHRIPVYYHADGRMVAAHSLHEAASKLGITDISELRQDADVLDTWFSSWLWPMTTMDWLIEEKGGDHTEAMSHYLPTNLLVTGPDIIFFWVARMIMATLKFKGTIPFKDVYFTSIIRDGKGKKMSKSLGNSPDPLDVIKKYGADALRFTVTYLAPLGTDIRFEVTETQDTPQVELGRNFANKLWNAGRFIQMKMEECNLDNPRMARSSYSLSAADEWIQGRFVTTQEKTIEYLENYRLTEYAKNLYEFIWRDFCDWYVEIFKIQYNALQSNEQKQELVCFALQIFEGMITLLHPVMPFITEELWHGLFSSPDSDSLSVQILKHHDSSLLTSNVAMFSSLQEIVEEIRSMRANAQIPPSKKIPVFIRLSEDLSSDFFDAQLTIISSLAKCETLEFLTKDSENPQKCISSVIKGVEIFIQADAAIDVHKEIEKLEKEKARLAGLIISIEKKLSNEGFIAKAPENVIIAEKEKLASIKDSLQKVETNLSALQ